MITTPTVLILGAGASASYRLPHGGDLIRHIQSRLSNKNSIFYRGILNAGFSEKEMSNFISAVTKANPPSLDIFLEGNAELIRLGKHLIALTIKNIENTTDFNASNDDWLRYLFYTHLKTNYWDIHNNQLSIITFNYDRSVEQHLHDMLSGNNISVEQDKISEAINKLKILHVYDKLGPLEWQDSNGISFRVQEKELSSSNDILSKMANNIKIMPEASGYYEKFEEAKRLIREAKVVYFMGFGYHIVNLNRIDFPHIIKPGGFTPGKILQGTAWDLKPLEKKRLISNSNGLFNEGLNSNLRNVKCLSFLQEYAKIE